MIKNNGKKYSISKYTPNNAVKIQKLLEHLIDKIQLENLDLKDEITIDNNEFKRLGIADNDISNIIFNLNSINGQKFIGLRNEEKIQSLQQRHQHYQEKLEKAWELDEAKMPDSIFGGSHGVLAYPMVMERLTSDVEHLSHISIFSLVAENSFDILKGILAAFKKEPNVNKDVLADQSPAAGAKKIFKFPDKLPAGTKWENFIIKFLDEENVFIQIKQLKRNANYKDMGFIGRGKNSRPSEAWTFLKVLARVDVNGELTIKDPQAKDKYKKQKELLSKSLQNYFALDYDPFYPYHSSLEKSGNSYKIKITLIPPPQEREDNDKIDNGSDDLGVNEYLNEQAPAINE